MSALSPAIRSEGGKVRRVAVVGAGVSGLMTAIELSRAKVPVDVFSLLPARRSASGACDGGINAALDPRGEGDTPELHLEESMRAAEGLAHRAPLEAMTRAAPRLVELLARMGVPFHRTGEGRPDARRLAGASKARAAFAGALTGQQILFALDAHLRSLEAEPCIDERGVVIPGEPLVRRFEGWDFIRVVRDEGGICVGFVAQDLKSMSIQAFACDAVVLATGGAAGLFGRAGGASIGHALASAFGSGAAFANAELVAAHPTVSTERGRPRVVSGAALAEGGRLWVPRDPKDARAPRDIPERERDYFLERLFPEWGGFVGPDVVARTIHRLAVHDRAGVAAPDSKEPGRAVYLDLTHAFGAIAGIGPRPDVAARLAGVVDEALTFDKIDLRKEPMRVFPAVHATLGGLWVDHEPSANGGLVVGSPRNHATSVPGLYAVGAAASQYRGAQALPGNELLASVFGGGLCASAVAAYRSAMARSALDLPRSIFEKVEKAETEAYAAILKSNRDGDGAENAYALFDELSKVLSDACSVERDDAALDEAATALRALEGRAERVKVNDTATRSNVEGPFVRRLREGLRLAQLIVASARARDESRGVHFKAKAPARKEGTPASTLAIADAGGAPKLVHEIEYACAGKTVRATDAIDLGDRPVPPREVAKPFVIGRVAFGSPAKDSKEPKEGREPKENREPKEPREGKERRREKGA